MSDPVRLRDSRSEASETLRKLLEAGRAEKPGAERLRGVAERLGLPTASGGAGLLAKSGGAGPGLLGATKFGAAVLLVGAATGAFALRRTLPAASTPPPVATAPAAEMATTLARPELPLLEPPESSPIAAPVSQPRPKHPARSANNTAPTPGAPVATSEPVAPAPATGVPATWGSSVVVPPQAPAEETPPAPGDLLEDARHELAGHPARALDLALRHERLFGGHVEDREVVILEALARLGRTEEGRVRAARFLHTFPDSSHRDEIATLFGFDRAPQNP